VEPDEWQVWQNHICVQDGKEFGQPHLHQQQSQQVCVCHHSPMTRGKPNGDPVLFMKQNSEDMMVLNPKPMAIPRDPIMQSSIIPMQPLNEMEGRQNYELSWICVTLASCNVLQLKHDLIISHGIAMRRDLEETSMAFQLNGACLLNLCINRRSLCNIRQGQNR